MPNQVYISFEKMVKSVSILFECSVLIEFVLMAGW